MPRRPLYSSKPAEIVQPVSAAPSAVLPSPPVRLKKARVWLSAHSLWMAVLLLSLVCAALVFQITQRAPRVLTQKDIDAAVLQTLQKNVLPSQAAEAYENVRPSIVRVVSFVKKSRLEDMKVAKLAKNAPLADRKSVV